MIKFKSITIQGFGSIIKPITYNLDTPGLNLLLGPNGVGKTTILNALSWGLYKQVLKKGCSILPWPHIITKDYKGLMVEIFFEVGNDKYTIVRCNEFKGKVFNRTGGNRLIIIANGEELFEGVRDKADHQKWINKKIGYSFDLFKSTVLFGQELIRLMKEDGPSKKRVFEEAFESMFIVRARDIVEARISTRRKELEQSSHNISLLKSKLESLTEQIEQAKGMNKSFEENKQCRIDALKAKIDAQMKEGQKLTTELVLKNPERLEKQIKEIEKEIKALEVDKDKGKKLSDKKFKLEFEILGNKDKIEECISKIAALKDEYTNIPKKCKACGRDLPPESIAEYKEKIKTQMNLLKKEQVKKLELAGDLDKLLAKTTKAIGILDLKFSKIDLLNTRSKKLRERIEQAKTITNDLKKITVQIEEAKEAIGLIRRETLEKVDSVAELSEKRRKLRKEITETKESHKDCKKAFKIDEWLLNDALSNSGLKAMIFDSMLTKLNNKLRKEYTNLVRFQIKVYVEMSMANKPILISVQKGGDEVPYEDLSKGQKQLADVALAFALNDLVSENKPINLLLMDEIFESLSEENIEAVGNIIIQKSKNKSIHIITHQSQFNPPNSHKVYLSLNGEGQTMVEKG